MGTNRSIDVRLVDRRQRRIVIAECWNTFGDLGAAARSSNAKVRDEEQHAVAIAGDGERFTVHLVWVVRDVGEPRARRPLPERVRDAAAWLVGGLAEGADDAQPTTDTAGARLVRRELDAPLRASDAPLDSRELPRMQGGIRR